MATCAGLVGTLILARAVDDEAFAREVLAAGRRSSGGGARPRARTTRAGGRRAKGGTQGPPSPS